MQRNNASCSPILTRTKLASKLVRQARPSESCVCSILILSQPKTIMQMLISSEIEYKAYESITVELERIRVSPDRRACDGSALKPRWRGKVGPVLGRFKQSCQWPKCNHDTITAAVVRGVVLIQPSPAPGAGMTGSCCVPMDGATPDDP